MSDIRVGNVVLSYCEATESHPFPSYEGASGSINIKVSQAPWGRWTGHLIMSGVGMIKTKEYSTAEESAKELNCNSRSLYEELGPIIQLTQNIKPEGRT